MSTSKDYIILLFSNSLVQKFVVGIFAFKNLEKTINFYSWFYYILKSEPETQFIQFIKQIPLNRQMFWSILFQNNEDG